MCSLKGTFVLPKKKVAPPPPKKVEAPAKGSNNSTTVVNLAPEPLKDITWMYGVNNNPVTNLGPADGTPEYIVNTFLGVKVTQGEKLLRKSSDSKMHTSYEVKHIIQIYFSFYDD